MREAFINSQAGGVTFDFTGLPMGDATIAKLHDDFVNWGWQQLNTAVQSVLGSSSSSTPATGGDGSSSSSSNAGVTGSSVGSDLGQDRGDDGMEHVTRNESSFASFSFDEYYRERDSIAYETVQQGTLPNVANFEQYAETINANDPFFAQIHATMTCNADFAKFNIVSVNANCKYTKSNPATVAGFTFKTPDDVLEIRFRHDQWRYALRISIQRQLLRPESGLRFATFTTEDQVTTLDVGTMGVLYVNLTASNIDWTTVKQVQLALQYPTPIRPAPAISREFAFDTNTRTATLVVVLLKPVDKQYTYTVTYVLTTARRS